MDVRRAQNIEDLRQAARRRLPRIAWDYLEGGAEEEYTANVNRDVFGKIRFCPRTLVNVGGRSQQVTVFGKTFASPFGLAPTGAAGLYGFRADTALARAARAAGIPFVISTAAFEAMEDVARDAAGATLWFQLYMSKDRDAALALVNRARDAGYEALVVTTDVPVIGNREFNRRNGFEIPFRLSGRNMVDGLLHPRWLAGVFARTLAHSGVPRFLNTDSNVGGKVIAKSLMDFRSRRTELVWDDMRWLRSVWPGKLLIKGILRADDALAALECGADGIFISNHGGRQLDGAVSPIEVLPAIRAAVGRRLAVMVDGGFRRGADIVKAHARGADMAFVGRAPLYGIAAGGEAGAARALELLREEVDRVLALLGCPDVAGVGADFLWCPELSFVPAPHVRPAVPQMQAV